MSNEMVQFDSNLYYEDAGSNEKLDRNDLAIPRLVVLQALSPQVQKRDAAYVEGAETGCILNTANNAIYDGEKGLFVVPVAYRRTYMEWKPRKDGGGLVKDHGLNQAIVAQAFKNPEKGGLKLPNGNDLVETGEHYVMIISGEIFSPAIISMSSTQLPVNKRWNTLVSQITLVGPQGQFNPPRFYQSYKLTTAPKQNEKGSWFVWCVEYHLPTVELENGKAIYIACRELKQQITDGKVQVSPPTTENQDS